IERGELDPYFDELAEAIEATVDLDLLLQVTKAAELDQTSKIFESQDNMQEIHLAVAKDAAFNFYYEENFELLKANGAKLHFFSPLDNEPVPEQAQGLYIGGGFPEEFADKLAQNEQAKNSIKLAIEKVIPTLAECGGFMYLTEEIFNREGNGYKMLGVIPGIVRMQNKL